MPYDLTTYSSSGMPHLSHTSLMGPLVNPFVPSHILSLLQEDAKQPSEKASSAVAANLRPFHIYDPADPISALSVPATNELQTRCKNSAEQSPSTQVCVFVYVPEVVLFSHAAKL
ncbi:unnamed protein product [Gongylonema pulchrum]|uniref:Uncharacterized protein n=1 Tax=Gongylonema pulchrum TaxID=637853 RepID=A0A3P6S0F1_9BILA|nr:unnamed protein product [Gongylonema pulchrum]